MPPETEILIQWLRQVCGEYEHLPAALFQRGGKPEWPLTLKDEDDLLARSSVERFKTLREKLANDLKFEVWERLDKKVATLNLLISTVD